MNNKDSIINKIINDAKAEAKEIVASAEAKRAEAVKKAEEDIKKREEEALSPKEDVIAAIISRRVTVARIDAKKNVLMTENAIMEKAFNEALDAVVSDKKYGEILVALLEKYLEDGDEVVIAENDKKIVTSAVVKRIAKSKGINAELSSMYGDFKGGMMLVGKSYDKNLTLERTLFEVKEEISSSLFQILFEEEKS
ncbi:MAG: hypothetical protein HFK07_06445 [Clostridia bacterium]|jgi:V/A-type H+-transporting ATPase subunit E|nr:hypothetical protein [Clostridia bacterium]MCX4367164.1 V-type ATP synthase subunit E family protein [Clostridia bacterium]